MKIAIMQPYFFPYIGYFQLINAVDLFVLYDDVNYIKGGWINRNRLLLNGKSHLITLRVRKASPNRLINEIELDGYQKKSIKSFRQAYQKAPYFNDVMPIIEDIYSYSSLNLAKFLHNSIRQVQQYIQCHTPVIFSSQIPKNKNSKGAEKIVNICSIINAEEYINAIGGTSLYSKEFFTNKGIMLKFLKTDRIEYPQFDNVFVPNLSIIDTLMFNSLKKVQCFLNAYKLI